MSDQQAYLGRSLDGRLYDANKRISNDLEDALRKNNTLGMLASGNTFKEFENIVLRSYEATFKEAAAFVFNLTERNDEEISKLLEFFAGRLRDVTLELLKNMGLRTGAKDQVVAEQLFNYQQGLDARKVRLMDDFKYGMMGSERLKRDPVVSVVQSDSPGAILQVGVGHVSQSALIDNRQALVQAIDQALNSAEFKALTPDQQVGFKDIADTLKDETAKETPDGGKLKRCGLHPVPKTPS